MFKKTNSKKKYLICLILFITVLNTFFAYAAKVIQKDLFNNQSSGYIIDSSEKLFFENGDVMDITGTIYHTDGTVTLPNGAIKDMYGIIHYADGSIKLPNGTTYYINGSVGYFANEQSVETEKKEEVKEKINKATGSWEYDPLINGWKYRDKQTGAVFKNQWITASNAQGKEAWYAVDNDGNMITGWVKDSGKFYYMSQKPSTMGELVKGEMTIDGKKYEFKLDTGELLKGEEPRRDYEVVGAVNHKSGKDGTWKRYKTGERYFVSFFDTFEGTRLEIPPTGWYMVDGHYYYFDKYGIPQKGFVVYDGKYYYMNNDGTLKEGGKIVFNNFTYVFDKATGACVEIR